MDKSTQHTSPKNIGAYQPPPSKGQQNPSKGNMPGKRSAIIRHAWSPKILQQHRQIHNLLEQRPQRMRLDQTPPKKSWLTCPMGGDHGRIHQCNLRQTGEGSTVPDDQPSKPVQRAQPKETKNNNGRNN
jgi:hypothetical protein